MDKNKIWGTALSFLKDNSTGLSYNTWLAPLSIHHIEEDAGIIYLSWPNEANLINLLNKHYLPLIEKALNKTRKKTKPMTRYEKLLDLMKNHLGCTEVKNTSP